jgi:hypothetical protein
MGGLWDFISQGDFTHKEKEIAKRVTDTMR